MSDGQWSGQGGGPHEGDHHTQPSVPHTLDAFAPSRQLAGRYAVLDVLGHGGMSTVMAAYDTRLDRRVALKLLRPQANLDTSHLKNLMMREGQAMARLSHPNVVSVYDAGTLEDGTLFIAMELVEGQTLRQWCRQPRTWREVLAAYLAAGQGLAAAHAAGLVHRDFKPENVLVGRDGRVQVTDFGLARIDTTAASSISGPPEADEMVPWHTGHSQRGAVIGTPWYMAPELLLGESADARSDLFAFCVALYEGLYGQPAFPGELAERTRAQREGRFNPPPVTSPVPAWVARIVLQGLQADPAQRPVSMQELIAALAHDPDARRRAWLRRGAMAVGAAALSLLAYAEGMRQQGARCANLEQRLAGVWDAPMRLKVQRALQGTGLSYARSTSERVQATLDKYSSDWLRLRIEACEATLKQSGPAQELALLEVSCLERRRSQMRAMVELLAAGPDRELLLNAAQAVQSLPSLENCVDAQALTTTAPLPEQPAIRARAELLQEQVDRLETLLKAGKYREGLALGAELLPEVEALGYAPLQAQALFHFGRMHGQAGDSAQAEVLLRQALARASKARDDILAARVWNMLIWEKEIGQHRRPEVLELEKTVLETASERAADDVAQAESLNTLGSVLYNLGEYEESRKRFENAQALMARAVGPEHHFNASMLNNLGLVLVQLGRYEEALARYEHALAIAQKALGPEHPEVANTLINRSRVLMRLVRLDEAADDLERAWKLQETSLGANHPQSAEVLLARGELLLTRGQPAQAAEELEQALLLALSATRAEVQFTLARALWSSGAGHARARAMAMDARAYYQLVGNEPKQRALSSWLSEHPEPLPPPAPDRRGSRGH